MNTPPPTLLSPSLPLPPPLAAAGNPWLSDFLPIITVLGFVGFVILIYALFFAMKCPPIPFDSLRRSSGGLAGVHRAVSSTTDQLVSSVPYKEEDHDSTAVGGGECPVCLTAFVDGEVIREVNICKHLFHAACIDMWLCSHSNCPVCRASIGPMRSKQPAVVYGEDDLRQGLPDSSSLV